MVEGNKMVLHVYMAALMVMHLPYTTHNAIYVVAAWTMKSEVK
jgi:hypothetical protein